MKVETNNNLMYDESDSRCSCVISTACGQNYAFIKVVDLGGDGVKEYWGPFAYDDAEASIEEIMLSGGKWPNLPTEKK